MSSGETGVTSSRALGLAVATHLDAIALAVSCPEVPIEGIRNWMRRLVNLDLSTMRPTICQSDARHPVRSRSFRTSRRRMFSDGSKIEWIDVEGYNIVDRIPEPDPGDDVVDGGQAEGTGCRGFT